MKVAITSTSPLLDAEIDPRFGRARYLLIVDTRTLDVEPIENPNVAAGEGAGVRTSQVVADRGAKVVLTGSCGPNAYRTLTAAGVKVCAGLAGTVREALDAFTSGELESTDGPSVAGHVGRGQSESGGRSPDRQEVS